MRVCDRVGLTHVHNLLWKPSQPKKNVYKISFDYTSETKKSDQLSLAVVDLAAKKPTNLNKRKGNTTLVNIELYE